MTSSLPERQPSRVLQRTAGAALVVALSAGAFAVVHAASQPPASSSSATPGPQRLTAGIDPAGPLVLASAGSSPSSDPLTAAENSRRSLGLNSDPSYVQQLLQSATTDRTYGVPLSPAEKTDVDTRNVIQHYGETDESTFAGVYTLSDGAFVVSFTDDPAAHRTALAGLVPSSSVVTVQQVAFSTDHLQSVEADLLQRLASSTVATSTVSGMAVDIPTDRVVVTLTSNDVSVKTLLADDAATFTVPAGS